MCCLPALTDQRPDTVGKCACTLAGALHLCCTRKRTGLALSNAMPACTRTGIQYHRQTPRCCLHCYSPIQTARLHMQAIQRILQTPQAVCLHSTVLACAASRASPGRLCPMSPCSVCRAPASTSRPRQGLPGMAAGAAAAGGKGMKGRGTAHQACRHSRIVNVGLEARHSGRHSRVTELMWLALARVHRADTVRDCCNVSCCL